jgi:hypothetical protein
MTTEKHNNMDMITFSFNKKKGRNIIKNGDPGASKGMTDNDITL